MDKILLAKPNKILEFLVRIIFEYSHEFGVRIRVNSCFIILDVAYDEGLYISRKARLDV